jgi:hypothetical protein
MSPDRMSLDSLECLADKGRSLFVGGRFNDTGGRPSKIAHQVFESLRNLRTAYINGGYYSLLEKILRDAKEYKIIYWFADVPNDKPKLVSRIKAMNKECILVTSKRNVENQYAFADLIHRALEIKSNLVVELSQRKETYYGRIIDPLGNVFLDYDADFGKLGDVLKKRVAQLVSYQRIPSQSIGKEIDVPDEKEFFSIIRNYAEVFHQLIHPHPDAANRFFGNASFRCECGFPSFRAEEIIYVSRRNVDKRVIDKDAFVAVEMGLPVKYHGLNKPSVDTPIQLELYDYYSSIRYIMHSHTYVADAPFTKQILPCGAIEEADEIKSLFTDRALNNFSVNLKGHGSLVLVDKVEKLRNINYIARNMPELVVGYAESKSS